MGMLDFMKKTAKPLLGIDITSSAVKLVELSESGGRYKVEAYSVVPLPPGVVVEKNISDQEQLVTVIEQAVKKAGSKLDAAVVAVSGSSVITKRLNIPAGMNDQQMEAQIYEDADQFIPYPLDEVSLDFEVQGAVEEDDSLVEVLVAACRKESVDARADALQLAGITPKVVDIEGYALERVYPLLSEQIDEIGEQVVAVADIGSSSFTFTVLVDGKTVYSREQLFGGKALTEEIQRRYGLSAEEAEEAKRVGGLPQDYMDEVLPPFRSAVVQQISRSLQFFYSSSPYNYVDHLFVAGGVAAMDGLADNVENQLGVPSTAADPFAKMLVAKGVDDQALKMDAPSLLLATGLAMRSFK